MIEEKIKIVSAIVALYFRVRSWVGKEKWTKLNA